jgi:hypothetical protein
MLMLITWLPYVKGRGNIHLKRFTWFSDPLASTDLNNEALVIEEMLVPYFALLITAISVDVVHCVASHFIGTECDSILG